jgi:branched-chain amino acid transport system permease protein
VTQAVILATIFLSITVITGFAGQISLCQGAFAAMGGFTVFQPADRYDMPVLVAAFIGAAVAATCGALLSLPVLRLGGVWFAIATLAFAYFFDAVLVKASWIGGGDTALLEGTRVPRPTIGPWDFANDLSFLGLAVTVFVIVSVAVIRIREGTVGRTLRALRGSEVAAASIGISPARARIIAFAVSAFIAGLGGAMLSMLQENVHYTNNFAPFTALFWLVLVVALGSRTVEGAAIAGASFALFDVVILRGEFLGWILRSPDRVPGIFPISPEWRFVLFGLLAIQFARHPEGLVEHGKRQWMARLQRRAGPRTGPSDTLSVGEPETVAADAAAGADATATEGDAATVGAEETR